MTWGAGDELAPPFIWRLIMSKSKTEYRVSKSVSRLTFYIERWIDGVRDAVVGSVAYHEHETGGYRAYIQHGGFEVCAIDRMHYVGKERCGEPSADGAMHLWRTIDYSD